LRHCCFCQLSVSAARRRLPVRVGQTLSDMDERGSPAGHKRARPARGGSSAGAIRRRRLLASLITAGEAAIAALQAADAFLAGEAPAENDDAAREARRAADANRTRDRRAGTGDRARQVQRPGDAEQMDAASHADAGGHAPRSLSCPPHDSDDDDSDHGAFRVLRGPCPCSSCRQSRDRATGQMQTATSPRPAP
jgi:hypothetical protein